MRVRRRRVPARTRKRRQVARQATLKLIGEIPNLVKLMVRLLRDARVSSVDKFVFGAAIAYVALPYDLLPDFLGPLGMADDLFLIGLALHRMLAHADPDILLEHWDGNPRALGYFLESVEEIGSLLPARVRDALHQYV
jgi:uncharacterized membrane protein YkvA (DUF1232 family)